MISAPGYNMTRNLFKPMHTRTKANAFMLLKKNYKFQHSCCEFDSAGCAYCLI